MCPVFPEMVWRLLACATDLFGAAIVASTGARVLRVSCDWSLHAMVHDEHMN